METEETSLRHRVTAELAAKLTEAADWVLENRAAKYDAHPEEAPGPAAVSSIIQKYVAANVAVVGAANAVPGPWGVLAMVPELGLTLRNQLVMIHDIGYALGKKERLTPPLLLGVLALGLAGGGLGFVVIKGQQVIVKRAALRVLQKLVERLAGKITQRVLKQFMLKWAPIVAPVVLAIWAGFTTRLIGKRAVEVFSKEIIEEDVTDGDDGDGDDRSAIDETEVLRRHAVCLVNLMNADGVRRPEELEFLAEFIKQAALASEVAERLMQRAELGTRIPVNLEPFKQNSERAEALVLDLVALALRDGELHEMETDYVRSVAAQLGMVEADVEALLATKLVAPPEPTA